MNGLRFKNKYMVWTLIAVVMILIAVMLEFFISNYRSLFISTEEYQTDVDCLDGSEDGAISLNAGDSLTYTVKDSPSRIYGIRISSRTTDGTEFLEPLKVTVQAYDTRKSNTLSTVQTFYIAPGAEEESVKDVFLDVELTEGTELRIVFNDPYYHASITGITINPTEGLIKFNFVRALVILLLVALALCSVKFRLFSIIFDKSSITHSALIIGVMTVSMIAGLFVASTMGGDLDSIPYPLEEKVNKYNPYVQQADAFIKGQLNIDYPVSDQLLSLENPYDYDARKGIYYLYDRAMYDGKYYSYFGIAPVINLYLPQYWLTGTLPGEGTVTLVYTLTAIVFSSLFLLAYVILYRKRVPLLMLISGLLSLPLVSNVLLVARGYNKFYYTAVLAGMAYLAAFLFFILVASHSSHKVIRPVLFGISGLCYAMLFLSRLNMALLAAFIVVPILVFSVILRRPALDKGEEYTVGYSYGEGKLRSKLLPIAVDLASLGFFVVIALIFTLWYNNARFGSPLEFGAKYQLTISDVSKNKLSLAALPSAIYHYFFQALGVSSAFPNYFFLFSKLNNYGSYVYIDANFGLFAIPVMAALVLIIPIVFGKKKTAFAKALALSLTAGCLVVALMNFCLGGVIFRYTSDMTLLCALAALMLLFSANEKLSFNEGGEINKEASCVSGAVIYTLIAFSVFVCFNLLMQVNGNLSDYHASIFVWISEFFGN